MTGRPPRVMVFIDTQNLFRGAHRTFFDRERAITSGTDGQFDPVTLGELLASRRTDGRQGRALAHVSAYTGLPDASLQPRAHAAKTRQTNEWERRGAIVTRRPLQYPHHWPNNADGRLPAEKGIDVAIAVDLIRQAERATYDVAIVCSADTDLIPAIVDVMDHTSAVVEVAGWREGSYGERITIRGHAVFCHWLYRDNYEAVHDPRDCNQPN